MGAPSLYQTTNPLHSLMLGPLSAQKDKASCHKAKTVQERFEEHNNKLEVRLGLLSWTDTPDLWKPRLTA